MGVGTEELAFFCATPLSCALTPPSRSALITAQVQLYHNGIHEYSPNYQWGLNGRISIPRTRVCTWHGLLILIDRTLMAKQRIVHCHGNNTRVQSYRLTVVKLVQRGIDVFLSPQFERLAALKVQEEQKLQVDIPTHMNRKMVVLLRLFTSREPVTQPRKGATTGLTIQ